MTRANDTIVLWDGNTSGSVWSAHVLTDANGDIGSNTTWTVSEIDSSTVAHPHGSFVTGVLGKWQYDSHSWRIYCSGRVCPPGGSGMGHGGLAVQAHGRVSGTATYT